MDVAGVRRAGHAEAKKMLLANREMLSEAEFRHISDLVYRHCGINLHEGKRELVQARLAQRLRATGCADATEYLHRLETDRRGQEFSRLIDAVSTNLTSFFREPGHFDFLRERLLPELIRRRRQQGDSRIRAWSAGCSTGEEPYSLAMTLLEALGREGRWDAKLLATDISTRALQKARTGRYEKQRVATVPPALLTRYFTASRVEGQTWYEATASLREVVRFAHLNLMDAWPFTGPFDFIFCRNVMIYFDKPTQQRLVDRFWEIMESGGYLFTGHSESLTGVAHRFRYVQPTIYMKP
jgi:chemotaxis protein methyltransferase CheR